MSNAGKQLVIWGALALGGAVFACGDSGSSTFAPDAGGPPIDASSVGFDVVVASDALPVDTSCSPVPDAGSAATFKAPTRSSACSSDQITGYIGACLAPSAADGGDPCAAWTSANAACGACIAPDDNAGPVAWYRNHYYAQLNIAGCLALELGEPSDGQCPATYAVAEQCKRDACDACFDVAQATYSDFQTCEKAAQASACAGAEATFKSTCGAGYDQADGGAPECFKASGESSTQFTARLIGMFCGE